jgi:hypothetical protein
MRRLSIRDGVVAALKSDTLSAITFEIGLFGWDGADLLRLLSRPSSEARPCCVLVLMQVGMTLGFVTALPANRWLITRGIKEGM